jgi:hypothetical protein
VLEGLGVIFLVGIVVIGLIAAFPLAWERKGHPCSALESLMARQVYGWVPQANKPGPSLVLTPNAELPGWFRCYVAYWRNLEVKTISVATIRKTVETMETSVAAYFVGGGFLFGLLAFLVVRRRRRQSSSAGDHAFTLLGIGPKSVTTRAAPPPVDVSKPITGEAAWKPVRAHAKDTAYQRAVETVRLRYQLIGNQMLLPNTLQGAMGRSGLGFHEAMLRVAEGDGLGGRRWAADVTV